MGDRLIARMERVVQNVRRRLANGKHSESRPSKLSGVWIDVGAYLGTETFPVAKENPGLQVYAFEPNLRLAAQYWGRLPNFTVLPVAVAESDGFADFYVNANPGASSLLPFNPDGLRRWVGGETLKVESKIRVPTVRLDTFMKWAGLSKVDYLKIDAQGADLSVVKSAGERIRDIRKLKLEVAVTSVSLYEGGARRGDVVKYLESFDFALAEVERQFHDQEENLTFVSGAAI